ncbi:MAG: hypothetical protein RSB81_01470 [Anaerovoracaceae bacterium]
MQEKIVRLNNSDLQLKEAEQKLKGSKLILAEAVKREKAMTEEDRSRQELYEKKQRECSLLEASATKREKEAKYIIDNQNQVLQDKAEKLTQNERTSLKKEFCAKEKKLKRELATERTELYALTLGGLLYSVLATIAYHCHHKTL